MNMTVINFRKNNPDKNQSFEVLIVHVIHTLSLWASLTLEAVASDLTSMVPESVGLKLVEDLQ